MKIRWGKRVSKQLGNVPDHIKLKFYAWTTALELVGLAIVRRSPGFHDELLRGDLRGKRSIRLNRAYRVIYIEHSANEIEVIEVNKHEY